MARELTFKLAGSDYNAAPVKLERKKIYGWTSIGPPSLSTAPRRTIVSHSNCSSNPPSSMDS